MNNRNLQYCEVTTVSAHLLQSDSSKRYVYANPARPDDIAAVIRKMPDKHRDRMLSALLSLSAHNLNMVWSVHTSRRVTGLIVIWLLNNFGLYTYFDRKLDPLDIRMDYFARQSDPIAAVAVDHIIGSRATVLGLIDIVPWLRAVNNGQLDLWTTPANTRQTHLAHMLGFQPLPFIRSNLMHLVRDASNL